MKLGVYAGSFNPFHKGHMDILTQASAVFDKMILARGTNTDKENTPRVELPINKIDKSVEKCYFFGLLSDFLKKLQKEYPNDELFLVRGLRDEHDMTAERKLNTFVKGMYPKLKVVLFMCDKKFDHISSSDLRGIKKLSEKEYQKYLIK